MRPRSLQANRSRSRSGNVDKEHHQERHKGEANTRRDVYIISRRGREDRSQDKKQNFSFPSPRTESYKILIANRTKTPRKNQKLRGIFYPKSQKFE